MARSPKFRTNANAFISINFAAPSNYQPAALTAADFAPNAKTFIPDERDTKGIQAWGKAIMSKTDDDLRKEIKDTYGLITTEEDNDELLFCTSQCNNIALRFINEMGLLAHFDDYFMSKLS